MAFAKVARELMFDMAVGHVIQLECGGMIPWKVTIRSVWRCWSSQFMRT